MAVGAIAVDEAHLLVGGDGVPHVREHGGHGFDPHAQGVRPFEGDRVGRVLLAAHEEGLPRALDHAGPESHGLAHVAGRVHGVRGAAREDDVHFVVLDEVARHLRAAVGVGLRVLGQDLMACFLPSPATMPSARALVRLVFDPVERAGEGGQRAGLREHAAHLDLPAASAAAETVVVAPAWSQ